MKKFVLLLAIGASACTTVSDLRTSDPFVEGRSGKEVQQIASCIAAQWEARSGVTNSTPRPNGQSLALTYTMFSSPLPAAVVDIDAEGEGSIIKAYARKGDRSDKLRSEVTGCL